LEPPWVVRPTAAVGAPIGETDGHPVCGLCGDITFDGPPADSSAVGRMVAALVPRGPDGEGAWHASRVAFDHRRLSVIDPSAAGAQPKVDETVLHAALVRSLVRVLAARAAVGQPCPQPRPELLRAARWRAARHGFGERLLRSVTGVLVGARSAACRLLGELEDGLRAHATGTTSARWVLRLLRRGTSAAPQRSTFARTGDLRAVAADLVCAQAPR
jgi:hypothetical protein